ncbi:hypothetical protein BO221_01845 [Archangium sp. Cb G35]|uniref:hypothetical protein n=1 Tax=Archangium sp. Cb G35 TaxID=1920190 RepID=UPI000936909D|nr:hypothetical protein [Archangium sp. Cb G35]OJT26794.1 hypothetical protein BO221_01845 [Archangium sp. Cb G35]
MSSYHTFKHFCRYCKTLSIPIELGETTGHLRSDSTACTKCGAKYSVRVEEKGDHFSVTTTCVAPPPSSK